MINAGNTAFVRTTNEEVFVLKVANDSAVVRRPIMTQNGIQHIDDTFLLAELEDQETRVLRNYAEQKHLQELIDTMQANERKDTPNAPIEKLN